MTTKILIDTDPGVDDAMAILFAMHCPELEILGLTTVFGNTAVEYTTANALRLVEIEKRTDIPVAKGVSRPLLIAPKLGTFVHGENGFGNAALPAPVTKPIDMHAVQFIIQTILANPHEVTLVPIGPLTNIALALRLEPRIIPLVKEVILMGGAATVPGNISPVAEANFYNDPHAARIVFNAGWPITMIGLDVCDKVLMSAAYLQEIFKAGTPATNLLQTIVPFYHTFEAQFHAWEVGIGSPDPIALAYLMKPDLFQVETWPIYVETEGICRGQTIPDRQRQWENLPNIRVCTDVNIQGTLDLYFERIIR